MNRLFTALCSIPLGAVIVATASPAAAQALPDAPQNVRASYADGRMTITWDPVTTLTDGSSVNSSEVTYNLYRGLPEEAAIAEGLTSTTGYEDFAKPDLIINYQYGVSAVYGDQESAVGVSNVYTVGEIVPPYSQDFDNPDLLGGYRYIDANNDGSSWEYDPDKGAFRARYNRENAMDDWLLTPPILLEAGQSYKVTVLAVGLANNYTERIEIKYGQEGTVEAMTETIVPPTDITGGQWTELSGSMTISANGRYVIGFHGISDADTYFLYVDDLAIEEGVSVSGPAAVSGFTASSDPAGDYKVTISFTAPTKELTGESLESLDKIELYRNGDLIKTFENPTPGESLSYIDNVGEGGYFEYKAIPYADGIPGMEATAIGLSGTPAPATVGDIQIEETDDYGIVKLTWPEVNLSAEGEPIDPSKVTYDIYRMNGFERGLIAEGITGTTHTFRAVAEGKQDYVLYAVVSVTDGGQGAVAFSPSILVGAPYEGFHESLAGGQPETVIITASQGAEWDLGSDEIGISAQDADGGYLICTAEDQGETGTLYTGKISLEGITDPAVSFWFYNLSTGESNFDHNFIEVSATNLETGETALLNSITVGGGAPGWNKLVAPFDNKDWKFVQLTFTVTFNTYSLAAIDNIRVAKCPQKDLSVILLNAPESAKTGESFNVTAHLYNSGLQEIHASTLTLYSGDEILATNEMNGLGRDNSHISSFIVEMPAVALEDMNLRLEATIEGDENEADNSATVTVKVDLPQLPEVTDLTGEAKNSSTVELAWTTPANSYTPQVEEGFESGQPFAKSFGDWTFVDGDNSPIGGVSDVDFPGIVPGETKASFFVFDSTDFTSDLAAHSGAKYIASLFRQDDGTVDDWAISPELSGEEQTISFYASSYYDVYPEEIEIWVSESDTQISSFSQLTEAEEVPEGWTLMSAELPEGTKHFAIRSVATGSFMLMLDDFTFEGATADVDLMGYDVYRDGRKINWGLVEETSYTDESVPEGKHDYQVIAVFEQGMSKASNTVTLEPSGMNGVEISSNAIDGVKGAILLRGFTAGESVIVSNAAGQIITEATVKSNLMEIPAASGIYIVTCGQTHAKVLVK